MPKLNKIDETDANILKALLKDSRTSFTEIARTCNVSVPAIRVRYKSLQEAGVINGAIMQLNPERLGFKCVGDIGIITVTDREEKVMEFLKTKPFITLIMGSWGKYNIGAFFVLPDIQQLGHALEEIEANPYIKQADVLIWTNPVNVDHPENLIIKPLPKAKQTERLQRTMETIENRKLDDTDRAIARILSKHSRMPFSEVAKQLNITTKTVIQRYHKLRKQNVFTLSTITIDLCKLGYKATGHFFIKAINKSRIPEIYAEVYSIPNVIVIIRTIGAYDMHVMVPLEDLDDLLRLTKQVRRIKHVEKTEIYAIYPYRKWPANLFEGLLGL
ncbi:MAG: Lrp/AsnC family transcriptional regulator [Candidatus Bathyarchaeia archaeon]